MTESGAAFSPCRTYRYSLWRKWDWPGFTGQVVFIGACDARSMMQSALRSTRSYVHSDPRLAAELQW